MKQNINVEEKILGLFFEYPKKRFTIREIAKITKIPRATVHKYIIKLKSQKIISRDNQANDTFLFKIKKINYFVEKIVGSGLIEEFVSELNPSCIIVFGSIRKGDSVKESDIDLFVESSVKKKIDLKKYERKLGHKIQVFVETDMNKLQPNLFNNVVNGIKLYGSFKIK